MYMWKCPNCDAANENLIKCENCGELRPQSEVEQVDCSEDVIMSVGRAKWHKKNSRKTVVAVLVAAVIIGLSFVTYIIISDAIVAKKESEKQAEIIKQQTDETNRQSYDENYLFAEKETDNKQDENSDNTQSTDNTVADMLADGKSPQVSIGILEYGEVSAANAIQYSLPRGIIIFKIKADSAAQELGLKYGDVITKINDNKILYATDVKKALSEGFGKDMTIEIFREDVSYALNFTVEMQEKCVVTQEQDQ